MSTKKIYGKETRRWQDKDGQWWKSTWKRTRRHPQKNYKEEKVINNGG